MKSSEVYEKLKELLLSEFDLSEISPDEITPETPLFNQGLGLDSIDAVELVVIIEKEFKVSIKNADEAREAFASLQSLTSFVVEQVGSQDV